MSLTSFLISSPVLLTKKWRCDYHRNNPSEHGTQMEDGTSYIEYAHYVRQLFLPASNTILIRLRV